MRKTWFLFLMGLCCCLLVWLMAEPSQGAIETRCGWLDNPTPANWWLTDRDGEWGISFQGGYQASGMENIPDLSNGDYVATNGYYGYGCACLAVTTDASTMKIVAIYSGEQLPLSVCHEDPALPAR